MRAQPQMAAMNCQRSALVAVGVRHLLENYGSGNDGSQRPRREPSCVLNSSLIKRAQTYSGLERGDLMGAPGKELNHDRQCAEHKAQQYDHEQNIFHYHEDSSRLNGTSVSGSRLGQNGAKACRGNGKYRLIRQCSSRPTMVWIAPKGFCSGCDPRRLLLRVLVKDRCVNGSTRRRLCL
jgi:hypothetical protein